VKEKPPAELGSMEDEEERLQAWQEWLREKLPPRYRRKKAPESAWQKRDRELRAENPLYREIADHLRGTGVPESLIGGLFVPTQRGFDQEMDRIESLVGRYPVGFRHYESFENYRARYPAAAVEDYHQAVNS